MLKINQNMKYLFSVCLFLSFSFSVGQTKVTTKPKFDATIGLRFINDYVQFCNNRKSIEQERAWVAQNQYLSPRFKAVYKKLMEDAYKEDPELGLDYDPIFNAQDYPDKGFSILRIDTKKRLLFVVGNNWKEFQLTLKLVYQKNKWLVDSIGAIK